MLLADHLWWHSFGESSVWLSAALVAIGTIANWGPFRYIRRGLHWVWTRLVGEPVGVWSKTLVGQVVEEKISEPLKNLEQERATLTDEVKLALENIHNCLDMRFADTHSLIDKLGVQVELMLAEAVGSRERIRQLFRAMELPVFEADAQGMCVYVNPAYTAITGLAPSDAAGEGWALAVHPKDRDRVFRTWETTVQKGTDFGSVFTYVNPLTGKATECHVTATALHNGRREVVGWVGTAEPLEAFLGTIMGDAPASKDKEDKDG